MSSYIFETKPFVSEPFNHTFERAPTRPPRKSPPRTSLSYYPPNQDPTTFSDFPNGAVSDPYLSPNNILFDKLSITEDRQPRHVAPHNSMMDPQMHKTFNPSSFGQKNEDLSLSFERQPSPASEYGTSTTSYSDTFSMMDNVRDDPFKQPFSFPNEITFNSSTYFNDLTHEPSGLENMGSRVSSLESSLLSISKDVDNSKWNSLMQDRKETNYKKAIPLKNYDFKAVYVVVRCRNFPKTDKSFKCNNELNLIMSGNRLFHLDDVFQPSTTQEEIYESTASAFLGPILDGKNCSIICLGPSYSGKSYTLGINYRHQKVASSDLGIIPRFVNELEYAIKLRENTTFKLRISFIMIVGNVVLDMLDPNNDEATIISTEAGPRFVGSTEKVLTNCKDILHYIDEVQEKLIEERNCEKGHLAFQVTVEQRQANTSQVVVSKVLFIELADIKDDPGMKSFELMVDAAATKQHDIPFNSSYLTIMLQDAFGGNCYTLLLACFPPITNHDVLYYLELVDKAKRIRNFPIVNVFDTLSAIPQPLKQPTEYGQYAEVLEHNKSLQEEIRLLTSQLAYMHNKNIPFQADRTIQINNNKERLIYILEALKDQTADIVNNLVFSMNSLSPDLPDKINLLMEVQYRLMDTQMKLLLWYNTNGHLKGTKIYVGCVPENCKSDDIRPLFEQFGTVNECDVLNRYAFVHMSTPEEAQNAIESLNHLHFKGCYLKVQHSISSSNPNSDIVNNNYKTEFSNRGGIKRGGGSGRFPRTMNFQGANPRTNSRFEGGGAECW